MNTEELQKQIENLPEKDKQIIQKIGELDDKELESAIGGLSKKAKNIFIAIGLLAVSAVTVLGSKFIYNIYDNRKKSNQLKKLEQLGPDKFLQEQGLTPEYISWLNKND
jgi:hypothetical protein